ncbi:MAG TPA: RdgB/HAM1 family non-canonical purine NTP pyrophosphatase [Microbacteriaceae bacterium]|nr:RdgB/HAM1 family non-canonical purine NTP pyrophosphatase [Microbacteriaceae bacterium]
MNAAPGTARPLTLVLATRNAHKVTELTAILGPLLDGVELRSLPAHAPDPVEDGATFADNALIKARSAAAATGLPALADDSGIAVAALGGAPGIHSARYAGTRDDRDNLELLLRNMVGVTDRRAAFVCAAAYVHPDGTELVEVREWPGRVLEAPAGEHGFGYDPIFQPDDAEVASAELTPAEKNARSHRTRAFMALLPAALTHLSRA